ncbi:small monomeric GTPase [Entamoeba marina]
MKEIKIILDGSGSVGKSTSIIKYVSGIFEEMFDPTIQDWYEKIVMIDRTLVKLNVLDCAGCEEFNKSIYEELPTTNVLIMQFSLTSELSFDDCLNKIHYYELDGLLPKHIIFVGNKKDLINERACNYEKVIEYCNKHHYSYYETSAKTCESINSVYTDLAIKELGLDDQFTLPSIPPKTTNKKNCLVV